MKQAVAIIDNKGLFYQKKSLSLILAISVFISIIVIAMLWLYSAYKEQILKVLPLEIVITLFVIIILNLVLLMVLFSRSYMVEKNIYKITSSGITQLNYYVKRVFPTQSHINWEDISSFGLAGDRKQRIMTIGTPFTKFVIQEKYQVEHRNFDHVLNQIAWYLKAYQKDNLIKCYATSEK